MPDHATLLVQAETAARAAGAELRSRPAGWLTVDSEKGHDVKLAADRRSEAVLAQALAATGLAIFSEEAGWIGTRRDADPFWLIDPLNDRRPHDACTGRDRGRFRFPRHLAAGGPRQVARL